MEHEIVERRGRYPWAYSPRKKYRLAKSIRRVRQCKHCGLSEAYIEHFDRTECRHQPTDEEGSDA